MRVQSLYVNSAGPVWLGTSGTETLLNCTAVSGVYVTLDPNDENFKVQYATLLAAQMANKTVMVRIADGSSNCKVWYIYIEEQ